jgi:hypothetical protein
MKIWMVLLGMVMAYAAHAEDPKGCYAYGRSYAVGESDCDGRVCGEDGTWAGVVKSGLCDVSDETDEMNEAGDTGRDPASVGKKPRKKPHFKHPK